MKSIMKHVSLMMFLSLFLFSSSYAADIVQHKLVIQVSTDDPKTQKIALNNAVNLQKIYGLDDVIIEIVAYGPGLGLMTSKSKQASRVTSLSQQNIILAPA